MIKMFRNDIVNNPTESQQNLLGNKKTKNAVQTIINANKNALKSDPYEQYTEEEMENARKLLREEVEVVKKFMGHGDIHLEVYTKVWEECYGQVC